MRTKCVCHSPKSLHVNFHRANLTIILIIKICSRGEKEKETKSVHFLKFFTMKSFMAIIQRKFTFNKKIVRVGIEKSLRKLQLKTKLVVSKFLFCCHDFETLK